MREVGGKEEVDLQNHALIKKKVTMDLTVLYTEKKKKIYIPTKTISIFSTNYLTVECS